MIHRDLEGLARGHFLAQPLEDEHVRIHRHAEREDDARDARQREHGVQHRHAAEDDEDGDDEADVPEESGEPVVEEHDQRDEAETEQSCELAALDRIQAERGGSGALLLDLHRILERVHELAGKIVRGLVSVFSGDDARIARDAAFHLSRRRGDDFVVEHDGEPVHVLPHRPREVEEFGASLLVEFHADVPALDVVAGRRALDVIAGDVGHTVNEQLAVGFLGIVLFAELQNRPSGIDNRLFRLDGADLRFAVGIHDAEVQLRDLLKILAHAIQILGRKAGDLDDDAIVARRRDDRLRGAHLVHTAAEDFDRLIHGLLRDRALLTCHGIRGGLDADVKSDATFQINAERDLALVLELLLVRRGIHDGHPVCILHRDVERRRDIDDRDRHEKDREQRAEDPLCALASGDEIRAEEHQQREAVNERRLRVCQNVEELFHGGNAG